MTWKITNNNYAFINRLKDIHFKTKSVYKISDLGIEHGLTVVLKSFLDDYFFPILPSIGWKVSKYISKCHLKRSIAEKISIRLASFLS
jgi:hypothetical protein